MISYCRFRLYLHYLISKPLPIRLWRNLFFFFLQVTDNSALDWNVLTKAYPLLIFHQDQLALAPRFSISHRSTRRWLSGSVVPLQPHKWLYCAETGKNFQCACMLLEFILQQLQVPSQLPWHMAPVVPRVHFLWKIPLTLKENSRRCCWRNACFPARNEKALNHRWTFLLQKIEL